MKTIKSILIYLVSMPWDFLVAFPVVLLIRVLWGKNLKFERGPAYSEDKNGGGLSCLTCQIKEGSWPVTPGKFPKGWYIRKKDNTPWGGTTLGHGIFYGPAGRESEGWGRIQNHEHVHVEQFEGSMLLGFIYGVLAFCVVAFFSIEAAVCLFFCFWFLGYILRAGSSWIVAILRGEPAYWGSEHEESARAQTKMRD